MRRIWRPSSGQRHAVIATQQYCVPSDGRSSFNCASWIPGLRRRLVLKPPMTGPVTGRTLVRQLRSYSGISNLRDDLRPLQQRNDTRSIAGDEVTIAPCPSNGHALEKEVQPPGISALYWR